MVFQHYGLSSRLRTRLEITMPRITIDERKANELWIIRMRQLTKKEWIWVETGKDRKSTRLNSSHSQQSRMPSSA